MIDIDDYTGLYFYSALLQGNASLLAILGVFVIYRLQDLKSSVSNIRDFFLGYGVLHGSSRELVQEFDLASISEKKDQLTKVPDYPAEKGGTTFRKQFSLWIDYEVMIAETKNHIFWPTISLGGVIAISMIGIILAKHIHTSSVGLELTLFLIIAFWNLLTIGSIIYRVIQSIKTK